MAPEKYRKFNVQKMIVNLFFKTAQDNLWNSWQSDECNRKNKMPKKEENWKTKQWKRFVSRETLIIADD